jgi:predicted acetyltransferase
MEYPILREKSLKKKSIIIELKDHLQAVNEIWLNYKVCKNMHKEFRKDIEYEIGELKILYTSFARYLDEEQINKLREICSQFLTLFESSVEKDNPIWFKEIEKEGDILCKEINKIIKWI